MEDKNKLLYADDSKMLRNFVEKILVTSEFKVELAEDGLQAIKKIKENPPDILITDIEMPEMDGFSLIKTLRTNPEYKDIPIIVLTSAETNILSKIKGMKYEANKYLYKPFKPAVLRDTVNHLINQRHEQIKVAIKSEDMYLFSFKNQEEYFNEVTEILTELSEQKSFFEEDEKSLHTFFTILRDSFSERLEEKINELKMGYYSDKDKVIIKINPWKSVWSVWKKSALTC